MEDQELPGSDPGEARADKGSAKCNEKCGTSLEGGENNFAQQKHDPSFSLRNESAKKDVIHSLSAQHSPPKRGGN